MHKLRLTLGGALLIASLVAGFRPLGPLPSLGRLLHPVTGVWTVAAQARLSEDAQAAIPGLSGTVRVIYDDRGVPHIFAGSLEDAVRALAYVASRDRLFQMELMVREAAGTLSELLGPEALAHDRRRRALGLASAAERNFADLDPNSRMARLLAAYTDGVNAWIESADPGRLPLEYHLLGARPFRWRPAFSYYIMKQMGYTLAYLPVERRLERVRALLGEDATHALFPVHSPIPEPIVPPGAAGPAIPAGDTVRTVAEGRYDGQAVRRYDRAARRVVHTPPTFLSASPPLRPSADGWGSAVGSNNWAVSPRRTEGGFALLAGDPHLGLSLPSIWYEVHLVVPGELDVYGVVLPGMPGVVIGFNRRVAWTFTNLGADVLDFYEETLDDPERPTAYAVDGAWRPLARRIEEVRGRDGEILAVDTVYFTHRGPLLRDRGTPVSVRWTVLEESTELQAFQAAAQAESVTEWLEAMERFLAPAQNALVADWTGSIAIRSTGRIPLRPGDGPGTAIRDGSRSAADWIGYLPVERLPQAVDPPQGFLASANQEPVDPTVDDTYYGADWPSPWRALRINRLLRADTAVSVDDMRRFQLDPGSARADRFVPAFLRAGERALSAVEGADRLREAVQLLAEWDRRYTPENQRAVLFETAMDELVGRTWDELELPVPEGAPDGSFPGRVATPGSAVLADLLDRPRSPWWDDRRTEEVEDRDAILTASLEAALEAVVDRHGPPDAGGWRWDGIRHANIYHLLGLRPLSELGLPVQGGPGTLNPSSGSGTHGASWRMVVELSPEIRAWTIYPGGQSGNPVSPRYRDRISRWMAGELDPVLFPRQATDLPAERVAATLVLHGTGGDR